MESLVLKFVSLFYAPMNSSSTQRQRREGRPNVTHQKLSYCVRLSVFQMKEPRVCLQNLSETPLTVQCFSVGPQRVVTCYNYLYNDRVVCFLTRNSISALNRAPNLQSL